MEKSAKKLKSQQFAAFQEYLKSRQVDPDLFSMDCYMNILIKSYHDDFIKSLDAMQAANRIINGMTVEDLQQLINRKQAILNNKIAVPNKKIELVK